MGPHSYGDYFPFDLLDDPRAIGLSAQMRPSAFGNLRLLRPPDRTSDEVTLFLHGFGGASMTWTPLLQQARADGRSLGDVALVDLPGFGMSRNSTGHLRIADVSGTLIDLMRSEGWRTIHAVGHSIGGVLALDMASRFHDEISTARLVSGVYLSALSALQSGRGGWAAASTTIAAFSHMGALPASAARVLLRTAPAGGPLKKLAGGAFARPSEIAPGVLAGLVDSVRLDTFHALLQSNREYEPLQQWAAVRAPVRAVFGARDAICPPTDETALVRCIQHATTTVLDDAAHFSHIERPRATLAFLFPEQARI